MDLKINDEFHEVNFWSFMKCSILVQLALVGLIYGAFFVLGILIVIFS